MRRRDRGADGILGFSLGLRREFMAEIGGFRLCKVFGIRVRGLRRLIF